MYGWMGKIGVIDLDTGGVHKMFPDEDILEKYLGGRGLGGYLIKDYISYDWYEPDSALLFLTGPLVNTPSPTSGRMTVMSRSPLTGGIGDSSVGGSMGSFIKKAGWDGFLIRGKAPVLSGIQISDGRVDVEPAESMANMETGRVRGLLQNKGTTAIIGPAAENGVRFSSIIVDGHHVAGRNGLGLVMAAKNLKYIAVKGKGKTRVRDPEELKKAREDIFRMVAASPALMGKFGISQYGTGALYDLMDARRMMPTSNFRKTRFDSASRMNAPVLKDRYRPKKTGCRGCHILCKKVAKNGAVIPEFETMSHFSALIENDDPETVVEANRICNQMGMDTISSAAVLACYSEIEGETLSPDDILTLLTEIGTGQGRGKELGEGSRRYAEKRGRKETAMEVKGQELPAYDPRGAYGMALAYATSTRGGCHLRAYPISHEILRKPVATDRFSFEGKARMIKIGEDLNAVADSLTACKFIFLATTLEEYARVMRAVTGMEATGQKLLGIGERIVYNERVMGHFLGFSDADDDLPERFFKFGGYSGADLTIAALSREDFLKARLNYYRVRGLDEKGRPRNDMKEKLGIRS